MPTRSGRTASATPPCSATCWTQGSTSRRPGSRRCSSRPPTRTSRSTGRWRPLQISSPPVAELWDDLVGGAVGESRLWAEALRPPAERELEAVFSPLAEEPLALGLETIYEGYLVHYGRSRLFAPAERTTVLLLGDYLYAHGLVRVAAAASAAGVNDLAELISLCAQLRAEERDGDGAAWAATAALLGTGRLDQARAALRAGDVQPLLDLARTAAGDDAVDAALAAHVRRLG